MARQVTRPTDLATDSSATPADGRPDEQASRREFLRSAAVTSAIAVLFGATTLDAVVAQTASRMGAVGEADAYGRQVADAYARRAGRLDIMSFCAEPEKAGGGTRGPSYSCDATTQKCMFDFRCGGGGQHYSCYDRDFHCHVLFDCNDFGCKETVHECPGTFTCVTGTEFNEYP